MRGPDCLPVGRLREDNLYLYLEKGVMAKSNAEQTAEVVGIAKEFAIEAATPDGA